MRIIELSKLIKNEESEEHCLKNCNLVIDAHSFFYNAYEESNIPYVFGCNAEQFATHIRVKKLLKFKRANVKCYFVFKGGDSDMNEKIRKIKTPKFDYASNYKFVSPIFMREVCQQMLDDTGVDYTTSVAENINDCVALAEALSCPILSNNVEFCFKKVSYIPAPTLKYSNPSNYIMCKQFKLQNFLEKHSLTVRQIAIFVTLSDIHVFKQHYFDDLLKAWEVFDENLYEQNKKILKWLSTHGDDEALKDISIFIIDENENKKFFNHMQTFLDKIHNSEWSIASDYLFNNCRIPATTPDPLWFEKGIATQNIAIPYINLYKYKFIQGSSAIEKKGSSDSIMVAMDIIIYAYNLLTNFQGGKITVYQDAENCILVDTEDFKVKNPGHNCRDSVFENGWQVARQLNLFDHFLKENNLNNDMINQFPEQTKVLASALAYFGHKKMAVGIDVTKEVYCFLIYRAMSHRLRLQELHPSPYNQDECDSLELIKEKYAKLEENEDIEIFDEEKLNLLVELQLCILHMNYLNVLCGSPHFPTRYHRCVNGTFMYKLLRDMEDCNVDGFIEELFQSAPVTFNSIRRFIFVYKGLLDNNNSKIEI